MDSLLDFFSLQRPFCTNSWTQILFNLFHVVWTSALWNLWFYLCSRVFLFFSLICLAFLLFAVLSQCMRLTRPLHLWSALNHIHKSHRFISDSILQTYSQKGVSFHRSLSFVKLVGAFDHQDLSKIQIEKKQFEFKNFCSQSPFARAQWCSN